MDKLTFHTKKELSDEKKKLLQNRLKGKFPVKQTNQISNSGVKQAPLSPMQHRIWLHESISNSQAIYNVVSAVQLTGELLDEALEESIRAIISTHNILRTSFKMEDEQPVQIVLDNVSFKIDRVDLTHRQHNQMEMVNQLISNEAERTFFLSKPPLLRVKLIKLSPTKHILVITIHHIISDDWSMGILIKKLIWNYNQLITNTQIANDSASIDYIDYCIWDHKQKSKEQAIEFWKKQLHRTPTLQLNTDLPRPNQQTYSGNREYFTINSRLLIEVKKYCQEHKVTLFNFLLAAFHLVLYKYSGQKDFSIGTPIANRNHIQTRDLLGCFINTIVLRNKVNNGMSVEAYIHQIQSVTLESFQYQEVPFGEILRCVDFEQDISYTPLFQVMFTFQNTPKPNLALENLTAEMVDVNVNHAMYDITLSMEEDRDHLKGFIEYKTDIFSDKTIKRLIGYLTTTIEEFIKDVQKEIQQISLVKEEELMGLVNIEENSNIHKSFIEIFEENAERRGRDTALINGNNKMVYSELNQKANQLARRLQKVGLSEESLVGIYLNRSQEAIIGILGILKAGGAYVPLDPSYPEDRIHYMIKNSGLSHVLTSSDLENSLGLSSTEINTLLLDQWENFSEEESGNLNNIIRLNQLAYIIYTSGSTGKPKGVMVEHKGLYNVILEQQKIFNVSEYSKVLQFSSISFDASVFEIVMALGTGATLYLEPKEALLGNELTKYLDKHGITHVTLPPSALATTPQAELPELEVIITAGERCSEETINNWAVNRRFFNAYGPTETTIWATIAECFPNKKVTIGKSIENVELYVLDENQQLSLKGAVGELYIGGISIARGYLNQPELTDERFISHPFSEDSNHRLYRTGDLVRYDTNDNLEFLDRIDNQVKLRGYRIELGEIQDQILKYSGIKDVVVHVVNHENKRLLVAFIVCSGDLSVKSLSIHLRKKLPEYMIPTTFKVLQAFPLTPNGKIDMQKLIKNTEINSTNKEENLRQPQTEIQQQLSKIWCNLLNYDQVGINQDFFQLGGHSLLATQLSSRIESLFGFEFPVKLIFNNPTIEDLESIVLQSQTNLPIQSSIIPVKRRDKMQLSFSQKRLWFLEEMDMGGAAYNIAASVRLKGNLNKEALRQSVQDLFSRHEVFRVGFSSEEGDPYQFINENTSLTMSEIYLYGLENEAKKIKINEIIKYEAEMPFDISNPPLLRLTLIHTESDEHFLLFTMHHIISDGWSVDIFINELGELYKSYCKKSPSSLKRMGIQYLDYVDWEQNFVMNAGLDHQLDYWKSKLSGELPTLKLPIDYERPAIQTFQGKKEMLVIQSGLKEKIELLNNSQGTTLFMTLLTGLNILFYRLTGHEDILVGTPIAGRNHKDTENMIGFFINTLVMRSNLTNDPTIEELLQQVKTTCLEAYENQDMPFEKLVDELQPERNLSYNPFVQVLLNVQNQQQRLVEIPDLIIEKVPSEDHSSKFDMTLYVKEQEETIQLELVYNNDLFSVERMKEFLEQFKSILLGMVLDVKQNVDEVSIRTEGFSTQIENNDHKENSIMYPYDELLHQKVSEIASMNPTSVALIDKDSSWKYFEVEQKSNQVANYLISNGVKKGDVITIYPVRDASLVICLLGILKAGAVFCILDHQSPVERLKRVLTIANPKGAILLRDLNEEGLLDCFKSLDFYIPKSILMDSIDHYSVTPDISISSNDIAYINFTSGTTGEPNAIKGDHASVSHFINWHVSEHHLISSDHFSMLSGFTHDPLLRDVFTPLSIGATLCIPPDEVTRMSEQLIEWLNESRISVIHLTPSLFLFMTEVKELEGILPNIRYYFFGGEAFLKQYCPTIRSVSKSAEIVNFYGATETPQVMASYRVQENNEMLNRIPIGKGIDGVKLLIMNTNNKEVGLGEVGEIYIKTLFLSKGYLNNKELQKERFINTSEDGTSMMYKTGDLGRFRLNGDVEIISRKDNQLILRGYRIEPGEIESALCKHPAIKNAFVCVSDTGLVDSSLVAYYVTNQKGDLLSNDIKEHLKKYIPYYMVPSLFISMDKIPITSNGKVDLHDLRKPVISRRPANEKPSTKIEMELLPIWESVLGTNTFGINDNFFDIGGHSLLLAQVRNAMTKHLNVQVSMVDMFKYPTIHMMSEYLYNGQQTVEAEKIKNIKSRAKMQKNSFENMKQRKRVGKQ